MDAARSRITRLGGSSLRDHSGLSGKKHWDQNSCSSGTVVCHWSRKVLHWQRGQWLFQVSGIRCNHAMMMRAWHECIKTGYTVHTCCGLKGDFICCFPSQCISVTHHVRSVCTFSLSYYMFLRESMLLVLRFRRESKSGVIARAGPQILSD